MKLLQARHLWGINETWEQVFPRIRAEGFVAIEAPLPDPGDRARFRALLDQYDFEYIAMVITEGTTVADYVSSFKDQVDASKALRPMLINSHSGKDAWSESESRSYFEQILAMEASMDIPVAHETHRGRILFNPWVSKRMLSEFEHLQLCCDLSHWVCVCERLLDNELDIIRLCAERCIHLHTRVGYEEGPQVPDPRAPEYQRHLEAHEQWWQIIWAAQAAQGRKTITVTPEFGPPGYLHTLPYTNVPVADLWEICNWQAHRQAENFAKLYPAIS